MTGHICPLRVCVCVLVSGMRLSPDRQHKRTLIDCGAARSAELTPAPPPAALTLHQRSLCTPGPGELWQPQATASPADLGGVRRSSRKEEQRRKSCVSPLPASSSPPRQTQLICLPLTVFRRPLTVCVHRTICGELSPVGSLSAGPPPPTVGAGVDCESSCSCFCPRRVHQLGRACTLQGVRR